MPLLRVPFLDRPTRNGRVGRVQFVGGGNGQGNGSASSSAAERSAGLLILFLGIGITLGIVHNKWRAQRRIDPVLTGVRAATYPFQRSATVMEAGMLGNWTALTRGRELEAENARLRTENDQLRADNEKLAARAALADRLLPAVGLMRAPSPGPLAAPILALLPTPYFDSITVARGTRDGIHIQTVARTPDGLIGQVKDNSPFSSEVMLLTDTNSGVSGLLRRKGKSLGIVGVVQGQGRGRDLTIENLKRDDDVQVGDEVVSSGYGGVFPADIPVGTVTEVKNDPNALFVKSAIVRPAAGMPGDLRVVYLLRP